MDKRHALKLGAASSAVIVGGVISSVLMSQTIYLYHEEIVHNTTDFDTKITVETTTVWHWLIGVLMCIIPGTIGLVAAFSQNKCMYVTTCIVTSIALLIMLFNIPGITFSVTKNEVSKYCIDNAGSCTCRFEGYSIADEYTPTSFLGLNSKEKSVKKSNQVRRAINDRFDETFSTERTPYVTCADFEKYNLIKSVILAFLVLTWVAEVTELVLACSYITSIPPTARRVSMPSQVPMLGPGSFMMPQANDQAGAYMMPQAYGQPGHYSMPQAYGQPGFGTMAQAYG